MRFFQNLSDSSASSGCIRRRGARFGRAALVLSACAALTTASQILHANAILNEIGFYALPAGLNGAGVNVGQIEANATPPTSSGSYTDTFEVNPSAVNQPQGLFTYIDAKGNPSTSTGQSFTFSGGTITDAISTHANSVGGIFYGAGSASYGPGVAPGIAHVDNYDANYFENTVVNSVPPLDTVSNDKVVNQSFVNVFPSTDTTSQELLTEQQIDAEYDNYTTEKGTIFVSAVGNGAQTANGVTSLSVDPPSTAYDSIAVAALNGSTVVGGPGPTLDGRAKPDIIAPGGETSYATPLVSGAAAIMVQAGTGTNLSGGTPVGYSSADGLTPSQYTTDATDVRTVKALLLNGAVKTGLPTAWTHTHTVPLSYTYGSGLLNVENSYQNLKAGRVAPTFTVAAPITNNTTTSEFPTPISPTNAKPILGGWDFNTLANAGANSGDAAHYLFSLPHASTAYNLIATLTWNAHVISTSTGTESINNLYLFLYNVTGGSSTLVDYSVSNVDNVQQLYDPGLTQGDTYDLIVFNNGGATGTTSETYAMAYTVPEPATLGLLALGATPLFLLRRRRKFSAVAS